MKIVVSIRILIASYIFMFCVTLPRVLHYYGIGGLDDLISPWATFLLLSFIIGLIFFAYLKNKGLMIPILLIIFGASAGVTFYLCKIPLPW